MPAMLLSKTIRLFLEGIGRREEYEYYLHALQPKGEGCFAAVFPSLDGMEEACELMVFDLRFLQQVELLPLVILCGDEAPVMMAALAEYDDVLLVHRADRERNLCDETESLVAEARARKLVPLLCAPHLAVPDVCRELSPRFFRRTHMLRAQGGIRDQAGELIWYYWLKGENSQVPREEDTTILEAARACLDHFPALHFSVVSPLNFLQELFTVRGAGSIVRPGSRILRSEGVDGLDRTRLKALMEDAFGRALVSEACLDAAALAFVEDRYHGAALLEKHPAGWYLGKFAVGMQARGEGLAQELWNQLGKACPSLFWRSRAGNPVNTWYDRQAEGRQQAGKWVVFWRGVRPEDLPGILDYAISRPEDFA